MPCCLDTMTVSAAFHTTIVAFLILVEIIDMQLLLVDGYVYDRDSANEDSMQANTEVSKLVSVFVGIK